MNVKLRMLQVMLLIALPFSEVSAQNADDKPKKEKAEKVDIIIEKMMKDMSLTNDKQKEKVRLILMGNLLKKRNAKKAFKTEHPNKPDSQKMISLQKKIDKMDEKAENKLEKILNKEQIKSYKQMQRRMKKEERVKKDEKKVKQHKLKKFDEKGKKQDKKKVEGRAKKQKSKKDN